ncbi:hypothetical protein CCD93_23285 [Vibrio sp. T21]|nr:hypothetical protein CCD93_23285 [Vibrio sp. T21]
MIPAFEHSGVLPPFIGETPAIPANQAPYKVTLEEFVNRFATSPERIQILIGLLQFRIQLKSIGLVDGFQWLDGSFVENVEMIRGRAPNDLDMVTFAERPIGVNASDWHGFVQSNIDLFSPQTMKERYKCEAFYVDLGMPAKLLVSRTAYWFGLFSHQRETSLWKGMLEVCLSHDETELLAALNQGGYSAS